MKTPEQKAKRAAYMKEWFATKQTPEAKARAKELAKLNYQKHREWFDEAKAKPCFDCGVSYPPYVMDFDHRPGEDKLMEVGRMRSQGAAHEKILAEIAKCDLVCANCHRERTFGSRPVVN